MEKRKIGDLGEKLAADFLRAKGYRILERNFCCRFGEADIIALDKEYLVFAEVKLRKDSRFAEAREFVDRKKQEKILRTARYYLMTHASDLSVRFDVIEVYGSFDPGSNPRIEHIENAFE